MLSTLPARQFIKKALKDVLARPSIAIAAAHPCERTVSLMRRLHPIQLSTPQLLAIARKVKAKAPCNLLVFGLGYDSLFWARLNRGGRTLFLEDNFGWLQNISRTSKFIFALPVRYGTKRKEWKRFLADPGLNHMELPRVVSGQPWDLILVDGPEGWSNDTPGRMKSIYLAAKLIKPDGDVFVHDCDREVENAFCDQFLGAPNLVAEIPAVAGLLRHYHLTRQRNRNL